GNLIVQCSKPLIPEKIIEDCLNESQPVKGFIGEWSSIHPIVDNYRRVNPEFEPSFNSKEILYKLDLNDASESLVHNDRVRFLNESDFDQWLPLSKDYNLELGVPSDLTEDQQRKDFSIRTTDKTWWGMFSGETLLSIAALNSNGERVGQVGGVFTPEEQRRKGYSKATMLHMLKDCREIHGHSKSILFTGETDIPAQKLYEAISYKKIGYFALILS
ncbi:GNAT family N-acetyltransferase, partial [Bdellovibrionales bacterium]|nr:GNAT family N-acetyltransferase [Bdellovibrionales bacterium]